MDWIILALLAAVVVLQILLLFRKPKDNGALGRTEQALRQAIGDGQRAAADEARRSSWETGESVRKLSLQLAEQQKENLRLQNEQQERLYRTLSEQTDRVNATLTESVGKLQESNEKKLDQMRETVDEKLSSTLSQRLDASFKTVGEQLQNVYRSLGEMKTLASDMGDLQRVLSNVKTRGTWAEVQLGNLLEQTLTADQFERNVSIKKNREQVEYAVKIPSREKEGAFVWLPIDSKFPQEDYLRLSEAADRGDKEGVEAAQKALERLIKKEASTISELYIDVPNTTDFAIMFLPTEGLYAEVLRRAGLAEELQSKYRVMVCGPTTITAFLNTLRMGFRTIALDKRAADVWRVLGAVKGQYDKFEVLLQKARQKIDDAGRVIDDAQKRNGIIHSRLRGVEELPEAREADRLLGLPESPSDVPETASGLPEAPSDTTDSE